MVKGLEKFKEYFADYSDNYTLIGGTACSLAMEEAGLDFRVTRDLDIVLYVEALNAEFVRCFWDFVKAGNYKNRQKSEDRKVFYRFNNPEDTSFPYMLELFSREPDILNIDAESHLTPIPVDEDLSSLSAILMDENYYGFIQAGTVKHDGLSIVKPEYLIPLKARAWLDITERSGHEGGDCRKHRNDVFRLYTILPLALTVSLPESVQKDMKAFLERIEILKTIDMKNFGLRNSTVEEVCTALRKIYVLMRPSRNRGRGQMSVGRGQ